MNIYIQELKDKVIQKNVKISGSKSESNRLLILQRLFPEITIANLSDSDDSKYLQHALLTNDSEINIGHAGTAMRFLTAFFAMQNDKTVVLSGSRRMHNRPIKILVDALQDIGAEINYLEKEGYPPLKITGKQLTKDTVTIKGNTSSQYISALLLMASSLPNGLKINMLGEITSVPYIKMTLSLLNQLGIRTSFEGSIIKICPQQKTKVTHFVVESDWSSASYFYSIVALSDVGTEIILSSYKKSSLQGDACLSEIYSQFGVKTIFEGNTITLQKKRQISKADAFPFNMNLKNAPDLAQTIAVTCFGLGLKCDLEGLHTLKIKETDRLEALKSELTKLGATVAVTGHSLHMESTSKINSNIAIETYDDHRMAMAFVPLAVKVPINIKDAQVVTKSYQNFWKAIQHLGFQTEIR